VRECPKKVSELYEQFTKFSKSEVQHFFKLEQQRKVAKPDEARRPSTTITSAVTRSLCTVLGMRARGHEDSKIEAHPQTQILMNLRSATKTATQLCLFRRIKSSTRRSPGIKSSTRRSPCVGRRSCQRPQGCDGLWRRSSVCWRSLRSITWQGGHLSRPHSRGMEIFVNLKGL
jgi:hypothetical protein